jgi:hypothetical protein
MNHLEHKGIVHRDLAARNVLGKSACVMHIFEVFVFQFLFLCNINFL